MKKVTSRGVTIGALPPPSDFGAPAKFSSWREEQEEAIVLTTESTNRFSILNLPTGSGKALCAYMYCLLTGKRGLILVETKGLADQYNRDVGPNSGGELVDIRGANNYPCPALEPGGQYANLRDRTSGGKTTCDVGPCKSGLYCKLKEGGCPYYDQLNRAKNARIVVTNYANWMVIGKARSDEEAEDKLGDFDVLICDEVHAAMEQLSKSLTVELSVSDLQRFFGGKLLLPPIVNTDDLPRWERWIDHLRDLQTRTLDTAVVDFRLARDGGVLKSELLADIRFLRRLGNDLTLLESITRGLTKGRTKQTNKHNKQKTNQLVVDSTKFGRSKTVVTFQPLWPAPFAERYLFRGIKRVIGMSATVQPAMMQYLGLCDDEFDFWEFDSSFPLTNRPIYFLPVAFMRYDMSEKERQKWARAIDNIFAAYPTDKGINHTTSYDRAQYYQRNSKLVGRLQTNTRSSTANTVENFKQTSSPVVLVSPSISTGYDFPGDECRVQVIAKTPFPDKRSKLMRLRSESDPTYVNLITILYVVQAAGRGVRSAVDWCDTYIVDAVWGDFYKRNKHLAPKWFREAVKQIGSIVKNKRKR